MADKPSRQVLKLLRLIEEKHEEVIKCEEEIEKARAKLENKDSGWSKARFSKFKLEHSEKIRGLHATINRIEKQRLNIERREREDREKEEEDMQKELLVEEEEERLMAKARKAKLAKKQERKKKKVVKVFHKEGDEQSEKELSGDEKRMFEFASGFVKTYRAGLKTKFEKKSERVKFELYGKYPYKITLVYKEPEVVEKVEKPAAAEGEAAAPAPVTVKEQPKGPDEVMLVFSAPNSKDLQFEAVEEKAFDIGKYKDIFRTVVLTVEDWTPEEAQVMAEDYIKHDTS
jgi:hypothetical protein